MVSIHIIWGRDPVGRYKLGVIDNIVRLAHASYEFMSDDQAQFFLRGVTAARSSDDWIIANSPLDLRKLGMPLRSRLIEAARRGDVDAVKTLIGTGLKVDAVDTQGMSALHHAAQSGKSDVAHSLINAGADVNLPAANTELKTPMHLACESAAPGTASVLDVLVKNGADINKRDSSGNTPLHGLMAGNDNKPGSVDLKAKILFGEGADPRSENAKHQRPSHVIGAALGASASILALISSMSQETESELLLKESSRLQGVRPRPPMPGQYGQSPFPGQFF